ncbi:hypothetical protein [Mucilaginibacter limnophilus]|uniref:hypothetical protein n=1 Tax=Mucilaginibacter limnophilus TaxID=1932778 RepID=UPI001F0C6908|nr:hypothetical protein [Mucilaginibacter limnophilus]
MSLFISLFLCWQNSGFALPFQVSRKMLMAYSRINSIVTYHKCIGELAAAGYFRYQPSYHLAQGSQVWMDG